MEAVGNYLKDRRSIWLVFAGCGALMLLTFFLYDLALAPFWDALLFAGTFLAAWSIWDFSRWWNRRRQLLQVKARGILTGEQAQRLPVDTTQEALLQEILEQEVKRRLDQQLADQEDRRLLVEDFSLWLHQIKTPVAAMDLLLQTGDPEPRQLTNQLFKISEYLEMMLNYIRANLDQQDLVFQKTPVAPLVKETVKKYAAFFAQQELSLELGSLAGEVVTDPKWARFILEQLLSNAIKYTHSGKITISFTENRLQITDTGSGIRPEDLPRIFEKGYTGYNGRTHQRASGLGLYLSLQMAERIGCRITAVSEVGSGTTMTVTFPEGPER